MQRSAGAKIAIEQANEYFRESPEGAKQEREAIHSFIANCLHHMGMYKGFNYLYWVTQGFSEWDAAGRPEGKEKDKFMYGPTGDQSRIILY